MTRRVRKELSDAHSADIDAGEPEAGKKGKKMERGAQGIKLRDRLLR
jgi:hypothetical protein